MSSMNLALTKDKRQNELVFAAFNQDHGCFSCGTEEGFCIYNCDPLKERFRRDFDNGGIGIVEMLFRCNILALVGRGSNPKYPPNKVMIWDDYQNKCIAELEFRSDVKAVKLRRDRIVVVLETKVYVYNFADLQLVHQIETVPNPKGLISLSPSSSTVLAVPGQKPGSVHIELYDIKHSHTILAHNNALTQISLNLEGTRLATTSDKGTLIRIFDTQSGEMIKELRRGADRAEIYSLAFSPDSMWIAVASDKGTTHIYGLADSSEIQEQRKKEEAKNRQSSLSFMKEILPSYFSSEWNYAQFRIPEARCIVCFGSDSSTIIAVCADGMYYRYFFDRAKGGDCKQDIAENFLKLTNTN